MSDPHPVVPGGSAKSAKLVPAPQNTGPAKGWRRLLPFSVQRSSAGVRVRVAWAQALVCVLLLGLLGWSGAAGAAYLFVKYRRGFDEVRFSHMLFYPSMRDEYRIARGDFMVKEAGRQFGEKRYREAFYNLRLGVTQSPGNREGRLMLAQLYLAWDRADLAHSTLIEGLQANRENAEYLQTVFGFLLQRQADQELLEISRALLAGRDETSPLDDRFRMIAMARATALFFRGNYDEAEDTLRAYQLLGVPDGQSLSLRIGWERGDREEVLTRLQALTEQSPGNDQFYAQYAEYLREMGRDDEFRRLCILRQLAYPERARPRIDLLYLYDKEGDLKAVDAGVEDLFRDFANEGEVLVALADFAANTGRPALARRIYEHCRARDLPWEGPALMTVEAHIVAREFAEALEATREMAQANPEWGRRYSSIFSGLQAIANHGLGDAEAAQLFLNNFLKQSGVRADNLVAVSNRLVAVGARDQARQVLVQAVKTDPLNQTALVGLIQLDLELGQSDSLAPNLRRLLTMRKPPVDLLERAYAELARDRHLFAPGRADLLDELGRTRGQRGKVGRG